MSLTRCIQTKCDVAVHSEMHCLLISKTSFCGKCMGKISQSPRWSMSCQTQTDAEPERCVQADWKMNSIGCILFNARMEVIKKYWVCSKITGWSAWSFLTSDKRMNTLWHTQQIHGWCICVQLATANGQYSNSLGWISIDCNNKPALKFIWITQASTVYITH